LEFVPSQTTSKLYPVILQRGKQMTFMNTPQNSVITQTLDSAVPIPHNGAHETGVCSLFRVRTTLKNADRFEVLVSSGGDFGYIIYN
jgi:hypothetical protein